MTSSTTSPPTTTTHRPARPPFDPVVVAAAIATVVTTFVPATAAVVAGLADEHWRPAEMCLKVTARHDVAQAGDAASLLLAHELPRVRAQALRALAVAGDTQHVEMVRHRLEDEDDWTALMEGSRAPLGGSALMLAALAERRLLTGEETYDEEMRGLGNFLTTMQRDNGDFYVSYDPSTREPDRVTISQYYAGEALWALARLENALPDATYRDAAMRAADPHAFDADVARVADGHAVAAPAGADDRAARDRHALDPGEDDAAEPRRARVDPDRRRESAARQCELAIVAGDQRDPVAAPCRGERAVNRGRRHRPGRVGTGREQARQQRRRDRTRLPHHPHDHVLAVPPPM